VTHAQIRAALRPLADSLPPGTAVPVSREWLLELLGGAGEPERVLITPEQGAARAKVSVPWIYRHHDLPFRVKLSHRRLMIDAGKLDEWIAQQNGTGR
jgi:hypothetical protein